MADPADIAFLIDVDNTLLDNDEIQLRRDDADLGQMATQPIEQLRALRARVSG